MKGFRGHRAAGGVPDLRAAQPRQHLRLVARAAASAARTTGAATADTAGQPLAAAEYGTPHPYEDFADQRDLWLVSRLHFGIPPEEAAQTWAERLDRADRRARNQALYRRAHPRRTETAR
jgi:hypothetical protein